MQRKLSTGRPVGRSKSLREDGVKKDLKKIKLIKLAQQVQGGLKWKDIVEKTIFNHLSH